MREAGHITSELNLITLHEVQNLIIFKRPLNDGYIESQVENPCSIRDTFIVILVVNKNVSGGGGKKTRTRPGGPLSARRTPGPAEGCIIQKKVLL